MSYIEVMLCHQFAEGEPVFYTPMTRDHAVECQLMLEYEVGVVSWIEMQDALDQ